MQHIESKDNELIKEIKRLKEKKFRNIEKKFIVEGFRFCSEALVSDFIVDYIFISKNSMNKWDEFNINSKLQPNTNIFEVPENIFKSLCSTTTPQGIIGVVRNKDKNLIIDDGVYILADKIQDPGNMGTIIRTAHAANALGVIVTKGTVDIYNEKTLRSTMGSIFHIPVIEDDEFEQLNILKKNGFNLIVSSLEAQKNFYEIDLCNRAIIAIGNEGNGISKEVLEMADICVKIPMPGGAESLNAAVATSIMLYEHVRQKYCKL